MLQLLTFIIEAKFRGKIISRGKVYLLENLLCMYGRISRQQMLVMTHYIIPEVVKDQITTTMSTVVLQTSPTHN